VNDLHVEVVYALAGAQDIVVLRLPPGASAADAVAASGLAVAGMRMGIGGREVAPGQILRQGDRVDILRPLLLDPKEARRRRARPRKR